MLVMGAVLGILQTICLISLARPLLGIMGVRFVRFFLLEPAKRYLKLRSLGALAVLLPLSMQGVFRGFKNTTTTLYATVVEDLVNVVLDPFLYLFAIWELVVSKLGDPLLEIDETSLPHTSKPQKFAIQTISEKWILFAGKGDCNNILCHFGRIVGCNVGTRNQHLSQVLINSYSLAIIACAFAEKDYQKATLLHLDVALHIMGPTTDMVGPTVDVAKMRPTADVTSGTPADVAR
ncbi:hypothetical protein AgCh_024485 [Apium graveolens]